MKKSKEPTFVGAKEIYFERLLRKYNIDKDIRESVVEEMCWVDIDGRAGINFTIMRILTELYSQDELKTLLIDIAKRKLLKKNQKRLYKGYLTEKNRKIVFGALMEFLENLYLFDSFTDYLQGYLEKEEKK